MEKIQVFDARMLYGRPYLGTEPELTLAETMRDAEAERAVVVHREMGWLPPCRTMPMVAERTAKTEGIDLINDTFVIPHRRTSLLLQIGIIIP